MARSHPGIRGRGKLWYLSARSHPGIRGRGKLWYLSVIAGGELLFHGSIPDRTEIEACAAEARRLRPDARVVVAPPAGPRLRLGLRFLGVPAKTPPG